MELKNENTNIFANFLSFTGIFLLLSIVGIIFMGIWIVKRLRDKKEDKEIDEANEKENNDEQIFKISKDEIYLSPTPLVMQKVVELSDEKMVANEELYEKDCTIGEAIELDGDEEMIVIEDEFDEMLEDEIVIDEPLTNEEISKMLEEEYKSEGEDKNGL